MDVSTGNSRESATEDENAVAVVLRTQVRTN